MLAEALGFDPAPRVGAELLAAVAAACASGHRPERVAIVVTPDTAWWRTRSYLAVELRRDDLAELAVAVDRADVPPGSALLVVLGDDDPRLVPLPLGRAVRPLASVGRAMRARGRR